jgi:hypothetical protein
VIIVFWMALFAFAYYLLDRGIGIRTWALGLTTPLLIGTPAKLLLSALA